MIEFSPAECFGSYEKASQPHKNVPKFYDYIIQLTSFKNFNKVSTELATILRKTGYGNEDTGTSKKD